MPNRAPPRGLEAAGAALHARRAGQVRHSGIERQQGCHHGRRYCSRPSARTAFRLRNMSQPCNNGGAIQVATDRYHTSAQPPRPAETSPYLQAGARATGIGMPRGEEALQAARAQDKPILLSIGYSACHWCRVMAHESFRMTEVAA